MARGDGETWLRDGTASDHRADVERAERAPRGRTVAATAGEALIFVATAGVVFFDRPWWSVATFLVGLVLKVGDLVVGAVRR